MDVDHLRERIDLGEDSETVFTSVVNSGFKVRPEVVALEAAALANHNGGLQSAGGSDSDVRELWLRLAKYVRCGAVRGPSG